MKKFLLLRALLLWLSFGCISASHAQLAVIDPANLIENILTATYNLQTVDNQIEQLQHELQMLENEGRNLTSLQYNSLARLRATLATTTRLLQQTDGLAYSLTGTDAGIGAYYPSSYSAATSLSQLMNDAQQRRAYTRSATDTAMRVQAQSNENIATDTDTLAATVNASQSAIGALQATQATNQLLALQVRQSMQEQQLRIANDRAQALEQARITTMAAQTSEMQRRFLGNGTRYTPSTIDFYSD